MEDSQREKNIKEKNQKLYYQQVETLKILLSTGAITKKQFDKSFKDLTKKMNI